MISATSIIYQGWKSTGNPVPYNTADKDGEKTVLCNFVNPKGHPKYVDTKGVACCICGGDTVGAIPATALLGSTYTDTHRHKAPESKHICEACAFCIMLNPSAGRITLSRYSFVASTNGLQLLNRAEMRNALTNPPEPPFVAVIAVSQKKHLATKASVSYDRDRYACMLEEERVDVSRDVFKRCLKTVEALRGLGCTKDEIESLTFRYERYKEWGAENYVNAVNAMRPFAGKRLLKLALHVAQKTENKEDCLCTLGFKRTT